jgi:hypothetical protein
MKDKELPEAARRGELIVNANPQPEVRKNAETARDWEYSEEAKYLYRMAVLFRERLIDPIARIDRSQMPDPVISFNNLRNLNTLAAYRLTRNPQGLLYEITFNSEHYGAVEGKTTWRFGQWALLETLAHELVHEWQQTVGQDPVKPGKVYHNKEFVEKCESIGLHPKIGEGYHLRLADGPFAVVMKELGVSPPDVSQQPPDIDWDWFKWLLDHLGKKPKGRSSLTKWECPECGMKVRMGIKGDPLLRHDPCEKATGRPVFLIRSDEKVVGRVIYRAADEFNDEPPAEEYNQFDDPEDLTAYLERYQN